MNATGEGLPAAANEIPGRRPQNQEPAWTPVPIHQGPEKREEIRFDLDLVDTDELVGVFPKEKLGIGEFAQIGRKFKIQKHRIGNPGQSMPGEG